MSGHLTPNLLPENTETTCYYNCDPRCDELDYVFTRDSVKFKFPTIRDTSFVLFILLTIFLWIGLFASFVFHDRFLRLKQRSRLYNVVIAIACQCQLGASVLEQGLVYVCWLRTLFAVVIVPLAGLMIFAKIVDFLNKNVYSRLVADAINRMRRDSTFDPSSQRAGGDGNTSSSRFLSWYWDNQLWILKKLTSTKGQVFILLVLTAPFLIALVVEFVSHPYLEPSAGCIGCGLSSAQSNYIIFGALTILICGLFVAWKVRRYEDPFEIIQEVKLLLIGGIIVLLGFQLALSFPDGTVSTVFSMNWISMIGMIIIMTSYSYYQIYKGFKDEAFAAKSRHSFFESDAAPSRSLAISVDSGVGTTTKSTSLANEMKAIIEKQGVEFEEFEEYLASEFAIENLKFYIDTESWRTTFSDLTDQTRRARARKIIKVYVAVDSMFPVNIPFNIRNTLEETVNNESCEVSADLFLHAQKEMISMLLGAYIRMKARRRLQNQRQSSTKRLTRAFKSLPCCQVIYR